MKFSRDKTQMAIKLDFIMKYIFKYEKQRAKKAAKKADCNSNFS